MPIPATRRGAWIGGLLGLLILGLLAREALQFAREVARAPGEAARQAGEAIGQIAERFRTGRITTTFTSALPSLVPGGALLELVAVESPETLRREDSRAIFFDLVPLGTTVSEIRVPVTYRYHVRLSDPWQLEVRDSTCFVQAPRLRPSLPPAIHTDRMDKRAESGWLRFDDQEQMDELEKGLTPLLSARAGAPERVALVRETARVRLAEFVRSFLLREDHWRSDRFTAIVVVFEGEPSARVPAGPTLRLEGAPTPLPQP